VLDVALEHDLGVRGHLDVDGDALDEPDGSPRKKPASMRPSMCFGSGALAE
jgi:hypothetical protein